jgi:hypothetical protein
MKKCMSGCGGKMMKPGGSVKKISKMKAGGGPCPKGYHLDNGICTENTFYTLGSKLGVGAGIAGAIGLGTKMISDKVKQSKAVSKIKKENPGMTRKEAKKKLNETPASDVTKNKKGGSVKKYAAGGSAIVGLPKYGNNPRVQPFKKGGATKAAKFAALAPPYNKPTAADRIAGAKKKMQDGGTTATRGNTTYEYGNTPYPGPNQIFVNKTKTKRSGKTVTTNATNELTNAGFKTTIKKTITDKSGNSKVKDIKGTRKNFDKLLRQGQRATELQRAKSKG